MWLTRNAGWFLALATVNFVALAWINHAFFTLTPLEVPPPDAHYFGIGFETARYWLEAMTDDLRDSFLIWHTFTLDFTLPILLLLALIGLTLRYGTRLPRFAKIPSGWKLTLAGLFPLLYVLSDLAENILVAIMLQLPEPVSDGHIALVGAATLLKFTFLTLAAVILLSTYMAGKTTTPK